MKKFVLTKTKYVNFINCPKSAWLSYHSPELRTTSSSFDLLKLKEGNQVGAFSLLHPRFKGGVKVESLQADKALAETQALLLNPRVNHIYEAAFSCIIDGTECLVRVDILEKNNDGSLSLIEVKSSTKPKPDHYHDLAFQRFVIEHNGFAVHDCFLMYINRHYLFDSEMNYETYFILENLTSLLSEATQAITQQIIDCQNILALKEEPSSESVGACHASHDCPCQINVKKPDIDSIENLRSLHYKKRELLSEKKITHMTDISAEWSGDFTANQQIQILCAKSPQTIHLDHDKISKYISQLKYPLFFLDFEALLTAVPYFKGMKPQQFVLYQASIHRISHPSSKPTHAAYLHEEKTDPRLAILEFLKSTLGEEGSIITYHQQFEQGQLEKLKQDFPQYGSLIDGWISRCWDLEKIFCNFWFYHPKQEGSSSIKKVLPVLAPKLSYANLFIKDGNSSVAHFLEFINLENGSEKTFLKNKLVEYNTLDTWAMIKILNKIKWLLKKPTLPLLHHKTGE